MELRVLEYFLIVAREQNITRAANILHITQPTLSRQLKELEEEIGKTLLVRGKRQVTLTQDGIFLRQRAEEIVTLARRTKEEMCNPHSTLVGDIFIGAGETVAIRHIARVMTELRRTYPGIHLHIVSGDTADLTDRLEKDLFDFCLLLGSVDQSRYQYLELPFTDRWGALMAKDNPLARQTSISPEDLWSAPLIISRQMPDNQPFVRWLGRPLSELNVIATYNLATNASLLASEGMGCVLLLEGIINTADTNLVFVPFAPALATGMTLVWKDHQTFSRPAAAFLEAFMTYAREQTPDPASPLP